MKSEPLVETHNQIVAEVEICLAHHRLEALTGLVPAAGFQVDPRQPQQCVGISRTLPEHLAVGGGGFVGVIGLQLTIAQAQPRGHVVRVEGEHGPPEFDGRLDLAIASENRGVKMFPPRLRGRQLLKAHIAPDGFRQKTV